MSRIVKIIFQKNVAKFRKSYCYKKMKYFRKILPASGSLEKCLNTIRSEIKGPPFPEKLIRYVISIEDRRFFVHKGVDVLSVLRVFAYRMIGLKKGGASTIGQQLVRTITEDREKSIKRKIREIILSSQIEKYFSKKEIVTAYLNIAYFGEKLNGVRIFSKFFFEKEIYALNDKEFSIIASCLKYPCPAKKNAEWYAKVCKRADYARRKAEKNNWIK